ncbi:TPA: hypothetical protein I8652_000915 [Legionella pneumophila]|nr:hypothetical protein [Legionella pneumophila]HAT7975798.1 hypothetical protein [Legionella pneumophila]HAT8760630.1 hypothetical protein [Legionella pneumophila]HAT8763821.1 hypothetical protein [Legionella pneumophila]HAT8767642.1 hypothetical protein [Legionella pneumophila]
MIIKLNQLDGIMSIENLWAQIKEHNGVIKGIKTKEQVEELIQLLSDKDLRVKSLEIEIANDVADFFVSQLKNMQLRPDITRLALPGIQLSHDGWETFFAALHDLPTLSELNLRQSNFDYSNDLRALGEYLSSNPGLRLLDLCHDDKAGDKTFQFDSKAIELLKYLKNNTQLVDIKYGHEFDEIIESNLSKEIQQILVSNIIKYGNRDKVAKAIANLQDENFLQKIRENLAKFVVKSIDDSLLEGTPNEGSIVRDIRGVTLSRKQLCSELNLLRGELDLAKQSNSFNIYNAEIEKIVNLGKYYAAQYRVLHGLEIMYQQELKASSHDKPILHNLREDFLKQWQAVLQVKDVSEKNRQMEQLVGKMVRKCEKAAGEVKDKTSVALIKNVLLILSAVLSLGVSLGIYALATRKERAARGSFFFKDTELSKDKIDDVKKNIEDVQSEIKKNL